MKVADILPPPKLMSEDEAKTFMNSRQSGTYQLVDVRLPEEYEEDHLPGANLVPLGVLTEGGGNLDAEKPTILY